MYSSETKMSGTQITYVEVVLLAWQELPDELLSLSTDWTVIECRFYRIAQADIVGALTIELLGFFEQLKAENRIIDFCSRVVVAEETQLNELPDWVRP
jgi:hypothetical protein